MFRRRLGWVFCSSLLLGAWACGIDSTGGSDKDSSSTGAGKTGAGHPSGGEPTAGSGGGDDLGGFAGASGGSPIGGSAGVGGHITGGAGHGGTSAGNGGHGGVITAGGAGQGGMTTMTGGSAGEGGNTTQGGAGAGAGTGGVDQGGGGAGGQPEGGTGGVGGFGGFGGSEPGGSGGEGGFGGSNPTGLPSSISAKFGLWFDAADAATVHTSGAVVTQWDSRVGGVNVVSPSPSGQTAPTFADATAGVVFDGTPASELQLSTSLAAVSLVDFTKPYEIFVAEKQTAVDGTYHGVVAAVNPSAFVAGNTFFVLDQPATTLLAFSGPSYPGAASYTFPVGAEQGFRITELRVNTATGSLYADAPTTPTQTALAIAPLSALTSDTIFAIGWLPFGSPQALNGAIGELIITQRLAKSDADADDADESKVRAYLAKKWNPLVDKTGSNVVKSGLAQPRVGADGPREIG